jgi:signal transduction histidine kinase
MRTYAGGVHAAERFPRPAARDAVLAGLLAVAVVGGTVLAAGAQPADDRFEVVVAAAVVAAAAWSWRQVAPIASMVVVAATVSGYVALGAPYGPIQLIVALSCFELARRCRAAVATSWCVLAAVVLSAALATRLGGTHVVATVAVLLAWPAVFVVIPALVGALVRTRARAVARQRAELLARGADEERLRVAREVHDIAGHGFAVVAMQAGVALTVFDEQPEQARRCLQAIRDSGEAALRDLHATLGALRTDPPGAGDIDVLVERVRAAGLPVVLRITGAPDDLDETTSAVVHRVVQEALTNVLRHAGHTTATVEITYGAERAEIAVRDHGAGNRTRGDDPGDDSPTVQGGGLGLTGLQARIEDIGGTLATGNRAEGGFEVVARLPRGGNP